MCICAVQVGIPAVVLERESGPREQGAAITFWPNAFRVLEELGVAGPLRETHPLLERQGLGLPHAVLVTMFSSLHHSSEGAHLPS